MIMAIADGGDVTDQLQLLVTYCSPDMDRLASEVQGVEAFFARVSLPGTASIQEVATPLSAQAIENTAHDDSCRDSTRETVAEPTIVSEAEGAVSAPAIGSMPLDNASRDSTPETVAKATQASEAEGAGPFFARVLLPGVAIMQEVDSPLTSPAIENMPLDDFSHDTTGATVAEAPQDGSFGDGSFSDELDGGGEMPSAPGFTLGTVDGFEPNTDIGGATSSLGYDPGSPLTIPSDSEEESESGDNVDNREPTRSPQRPLTTPHVKSSSRPTKPPKIFTSGTTLTQAPSKKRKTERQATPVISDTKEPISPGSLFWTSTFDFYSAAVSTSGYLP